MFCRIFGVLAQLSGLRPTVVVFYFLRACQKKVDMGLMVVPSTATTMAGVVFQGDISVGSG